MLTRFIVLLAVLHVAGFAVGAAALQSPHLLLAAGAMAVVAVVAWAAGRRAARRSAGGRGDDRPR